MSIPINGVAPLFQVFDMPVAIAFYRDILDFQLIAGTDDWVLLRRDGIDLMLNTAYERPERPPTPDPARIAAHDDTALFFSCPDVDAAFEHLKSKGLNVNPPVVQSYGMKQLYVHDPDGYSLCFQWPAGG